MIIPMQLGEKSYEILLEPGCLSRAEALLDLDRKVLVVTDDGVPPQYAQTLAEQCREPRLLVVPQGEGSKSLAMLERLLSAMLQAGFTRRDCVCAVGGGVVGDLAGFAAACYMRGIDFYNIPTTVLSQVDSSVGGKTAVDLDGVKNAVGAFHQPRKVLIDFDTLETLTPRLRAEGLAEAVKAGLIGDAALFALFEEDAPERRLPEIIARAIEVKRRVVEADETEQGLRRILNFGHTIGHGIESVTGLPHGACVALGMLPMCGPGAEARLRGVLERLGLLTAVPADPEAVYAALLHDKKAGGGRISVVRVDEPGSCRVEEEAPEALRGLIDKVVKA